MHVVISNQRSNISQVEVGQKITIPAYSKVSLLPQPRKQDSDEELEYADRKSVV